MQLRMKLTLSTLIIGSSLIAWPIVKNEVARFQLRRADVIEGYLWIYGRQAVKQGPVKLTPAQRQALLNSLDWDYLINGKGFRGFPMCSSGQSLDFSAPGSTFVLKVSPTCEVASFNGWTEASGFMPGKRKHWDALKHELFPAAPETDE